MADSGEFEPGPLLLMGAPGVGKGTQAKELVALWSIPQISTGDLLRAHVSAGSALGREARQLMDAGHLVPDELVNRMVEQRLREPDTRRGYILDGFPRTLPQAEWLDRRLGSGPEPADPASNTGSVSSAERGPLKGGRGSAGLPLVAVSIRVGYDQLLRRVTGRRLCPVCGSIYNIYLQPPQRDGFCDLDGTALQRRDDDSEGVFEGRMRAYRAQTAPVVEHYRALGRLAEVGGEHSPEVVTSSVASAVRALRGA